MFGLFRKTRLREVLYAPNADLLTEMQECFAAGFGRGTDDVVNSVEQSQWINLVSDTTVRLARERSHAEAGCWLAGVINGRLHALENEVVCSSSEIRSLFYTALVAGQIEEYALNTVRPVFRRRRNPTLDLLHRLNSAFAIS